MRGDRPSQLTRFSCAAQFTPHARGSTRGTRGGNRRGQVYPACAGIDRMDVVMPETIISLPRMRGDRPSKALNLASLIMFTPHARGSTLAQYKDAIDQYVYPACAGIDLFASTVVVIAARLPRMRGDRPQNHNRKRQQ